LLVSLAVFTLVFVGATYYAAYIHEYIDERWGEYIEPELISSANLTHIIGAATLLSLNKNEFIEYAVGSFHCIVAA
jgi:hypothetical protein